MLEGLREEATDLALGRHTQALYQRKGSVSVGWQRVNSDIVDETSLTVWETGDGLEPV